MYNQINKFIILFILLLTIFTLTGCDLLNQNDNVIELGNSESAVKWNLVINDNDYRPIQSAFFEFTNDSFKYYEDGVLKKEGTQRITFFDINKNNTPLHLNLYFGNDNTGLSIYDYIDCYTEDSKDDLHQFTIVSQGYHIKPIRNGGVPIRDYHLSDMPYALGTYVKEGSEYSPYQNGKVNYLGCSKLDGTFVDEKGNILFLVNNSYSSQYQSSEYSQYTVYMRYENNENNTFIEGTISLSYLENSDGIQNLALIHVLHSDNEPGEEPGTYAFPDYELIDFNFVNNETITFTYGDFFYDNKECTYDPANFIGGEYKKVVFN